MSPADALRRIALLLERTQAPTYRVKAFRAAAKALDEAGPQQVATLAAVGGLRTLAGVGETTEAIALQALAGEVPAYLQRLEAETAGPVATGGEALRAALRGDCHSHSDWSDGGSPIGRWHRRLASWATSTLC